jgi:hypothetical protein
MAGILRGGAAAAGRTLGLSHGLLRHRGRLEQAHDFTEGLGLQRPAGRRSLAIIGLLAWRVPGRGRRANRQNPQNEAGPKLRRAGLPCTGKPPLAFCTISTANPAGKTRPR